MDTISLDDAQARFPELVEAAERGDDVVITRDDGAACLLIAIPAQGRPRFGSARGMFVMSVDFDAPLEGFEG
jgi:antitoxin (DNA-binding transcriptional repressor) of toxin-antitoxin stability system